MKPLLRLLALFLALLFFAAFGCAAPHGCRHTDEIEPQSTEKDALWEKLKATRPIGSAADEPSLKVVAIDVGQGDCILLVSPEGRTMLIDAGPADSFDRISDVLNANGIRSLDIAVATHPHEDHIGSMADVLNAYPVGTFYTIAQAQPVGRYAEVQKALDRNGCTVCCAEAGMTIPWAESCTVTVLNPIPAYADEPAEMNDLSIVLHVRYGNTAVLLTGDAEATAQSRMLDTFPRSMLRADLLKLGHHGSANAIDYWFFLAVDPDYAVASCGKDNEYGHPHLETLSLLYDTRTAFYRTDLDGSITFRLDGTNVSADPSRKETP
jgi:beta-lactamase superfamily II metal-dependent hydrolase